MAAILLAIGCGDEGVLNPNENLTPEWQLVDRQYPYSSPQGGSVCAEYRRLAEDGLVEVDRELYFPDRIDGKLDGRLELDSEVRAALRRDGLTRARTCETARSFMRLKHEYFESRPSMDPPTPDKPSASRRVDKVREGRAYDHAPTVHLRIWDESTTDPSDFTRCSGVLINQYGIVTAAHCFDRGGDFYKISVDYGTAFDADVAMGNWCISNNSPNCRSQPTDNNFFVYVHPDFSGSGDADDDIAVAVHWTWDPWQVIGDDRLAYMYLTKSVPAVGLSFEVQGYGRSQLTGTSGGGLGRRGNQTEGISWTDSEYWFAYASQGYGHPCKGDSGSSAVNTTKFAGVPKDISLGVASSADLVNNENCPHIGKRFRYTKVNPKVGWINEVLAEASAPGCSAIDNPAFNWQAFKCYPQSDTVP